MGREGGVGGVAVLFSMDGRWARLRVGGVAGVHISVFPFRTVPVHRWGKVSYCAVLMASLLSYMFGWCCAPLLP